ncbi:MAG TPA: redoxin domain-containing protein [Gemmatimonadaceae bacterium]|nr:redoxin domain-containing protein [Gemmatimonadaceae bacterium]
MTAVASQSRVPAVGERAPDFSLRSTSGETVSLASFRGKKHVLLAFFPLAFSSVCTAELCEMRDDFDQYARSDVEVLPISVDSHYSLSEFRDKHKIQAQMLSDFKRDVSRLYGVLHEERFFSNRAYFLIDKDGVIRWAHVEENPGQRRQSSEILEQIAKLG